MNLEDFKNGGSKRKYVTVCGILNAIDAYYEHPDQYPQGTEAELLEMVKQNYNMCDGYFSDGADMASFSLEEELVEEPIDEHEEEPVEDPVDENISTEDAE